MIKNDEELRLCTEVMLCELQVPLGELGKVVVKN